MVPYIYSFVDICSFALLAERHTEQKSVIGIEQLSCYNVIFHSNFVMHNNTPLLFLCYAISNFHFFTGLGPCLPNNLSTYGARRFHISRSEWDRVFSRLTVVPGLS